MRTTLAALALLCLPAIAVAQPGAAYHDKFGKPLLFADVDIPLYDMHGQPLVDPTTQKPVPAHFCAVVTADEIDTDVTKRISTSDASWLQGIHYTLDLPHRQILIRHVWVLNTIKTEQSPGYQVVHSPRMINYDLDDYRAPLSDVRPLNSPCNWDQILANMTVTRSVPSGGGGGVMSCQWRYDSFIHKGMHLECPNGTWRGHITR